MITRERNWNPRYVLFQCAPSTETRGTRIRANERPPCGAWNIKRVSVDLPIQTRCECGRRPRIHDGTCYEFYTLREAQAWLEEVKSQ